jgi:hypothetical protein
MVTDPVETYLLQAAEIVGEGRFSTHLAAIAERWAMDKAELAGSSVAETQSALLRAGQLRIDEAGAVVRAARRGPMT